MQGPQGGAIGQFKPKRLLQQLAQLAPGAPPQDLPLLASEAMEAFQLCAAGGSAPAAAFAALLCVLGCAGLWDAALRVYTLVAVKVGFGLRFSTKD